MIRFFAILMTLAGLWSLVTAYRVLDLHSGYGYHFPVQMLVVGSMQLATGVGLLRRWPLARLLAMGLCAVGTLAVLALPVAIYKAGPMLLFLLMLFGVIGMPDFMSNINALPYVIGVAAVIALAISIFFWKLFWLLRSPEIRAIYTAETFESASAAHEPLWPVVVSIATWAAVGYLIPLEWDVYSHQVPGFLKNRAMKQAELEAAAQAARQQAEREARLSQAYQFSADERTVYFYSSDASELLAVDTATGTLTRTKAWLGDGILSPDMRTQVANDGRLRPVSTGESRKLASLAPPGGEGRDVKGFIAPERVFSFNRVARKFELADIAADQVVYAVDAPPARAVGMLSPDKTLYAYLGQEGLNVLRTASGVFSAVPGSCEPDSSSQPLFSQEDDLYYAPCVEPIDPRVSVAWTVYDLATGRPVPSRTLRRGRFLFASSTDDRALYLEKQVGMLSQYHARDLVTPDWEVQLPVSTWNIAITPNGRTLFLGHGPSRESGPKFARILPGRPVEAPEFEPVHALLGWGEVSVSPGGKFLLLRMGRLVELIPVDSLEEGKPGLAVDLVTGERVTEVPKIGQAPPA